MTHKAQPMDEGIRLLPASERHAELWWRLRHERTTVRHNQLDEADVPALARRLAAGTSNLNDHHVMEYRWVVERDNELVGMVGLGQPSWLLGEATVSILIAEAHQGNGLGSRAIALLIEHVFAETPLTRLVANISGDNEASIRMVERLGFERMGVYPDHYLIDGRRVTQLRYALCRETWQLRTRRHVPAARH
jgi:ribosomal-protein-alanine N-acetyltransferase